MLLKLAGDQVQRIQPDVRGLSQLQEDVNRVLRHVQEVRRDEDELLKVICPINILSRNIQQLYQLPDDSQEFYQLPRDVQSLQRHVRMLVQLHEDALKIHSNFCNLKGGLRELEQLMEDVQRIERDVQELKQQMDVWISSHKQEYVWISSQQQEDVQISPQQQEDIRISCELQEAVETVMIEFVWLQHKVCVLIELHNILVLPALQELRCFPQTIAILQKRARDLIERHVDVQELTDLQDDIRRLAELQKTVEQLPPILGNKIVNEGSATECHNIPEIGSAAENREVSEQDSSVESHNMAEEDSCKAF